MKAGGTAEELVQLLGLWEASSGVGGERSQGGCPLWACGQGQQQLTDTPASLALFTVK